jgi:hypothetical protein
MSISIPFIRAACEVIRGDGWRLCFSSTRSYSPKEASHSKEHLQDRFRFK